MKWASLLKVTAAAAVAAAAIGTRGIQALAPGVAEIRAHLEQSTPRSRVRFSCQTGTGFGSDVPVSPAQSGPSAGTVFVPYCSLSPTPFGHVLGRLGGETAERVALDGQVAYAAVEGPAKEAGQGSQPEGRESYLRVVDLSDPRRPVLFGHSERVAGQVEALATDAGFAYLLTRNTGWGQSNRLNIFDVRVSRAPVLVSSVPTEGAGLGVREGYAYIDSYRGSSLHIVDVRDPYAPVDVLRPSASVSSDPASLAVTKSLLVRGQSDPPNLSVFDISRPEAPALLSEKQLSVDGLPDVFVSMAVDGDRAYTVVDELSGQRPSVVGAYDLRQPARSSLLGEARIENVAGSVAAAGGHRLYISRYNSRLGSHVAVLDVEPPSRIREVATKGLSGFANDIAVSTDGLRILIADSRFGLRLWERRSAAPAELGVHPLLGHVMDAQADGSLAYLAATAALSVIDLSDPGQPELLSQIPIDGAASALEVSGGRAFLTVGGYRQGNSRYDSAVVAYDVTTPTAPKLLGALELEPDLEFASVAREVVWQITDGSDLVATDMDDPSLPRRLSTLALPEQAKVLALGGDAAFVMVQVEPSYFSRCDILSVDVSDPASPNIVGRHVVDGLRRCPQLVEYEDGKIYAATNDYATTADYLLVFDATDPANVRELVREQVPIGFYSMKVKSGSVYTCGPWPSQVEHWSLSLFMFRAPSRLRLVGTMSVEQGSRILDVGTYLYLWRTGYELLIVDPR